MSRRRCELLYSTNRQHPYSKLFKLGCHRCVYSSVPGANLALEHHLLGLYVGVWGMTHPQLRVHASAAF